MDDIMKWLDDERTFWTDLSCKALQSEISRMEVQCQKQYKILGDAVGNSEELLWAFRAIVNELMISQIHNILVAFDGGAWISEKYIFDIIEKETGETINGDVVDMHERFIGHLWDVEDGDPFVLAK